jgi:hypothetical protein
MDIEKEKGELRNKYIHREWRESNHTEKSSKGMGRELFLIEEECKSDQWRQRRKGKIKRRQ